MNRYKTYTEMEPKWPHWHNLKNKYSRRCEVGIIGAPWRAEALHTLGRLSLNLLLGLGPGVVVVDVVVVDVFGGRSDWCLNLGGPGVSTKKGPVARWQG